MTLEISLEVLCDPDGCGGGGRTKGKKIRIGGNGPRYL